MMLYQVILAPAAGARVEFRCRVFSIAVYVPHHHTGGDCSCSTLARWSSMIPSRLVLIRLLAAEGELQDWDLQAQEHLLVSQVGCFSSLELF